MLRVFLLFLLLIAGVIAGPMLVGHQGYVLIRTTGYNIVTSVTVLVTTIIALLLVLLLLLSLFGKLMRASSLTHGWFFGLKLARARKQTHAALLKLTEGDYQQAAKLFARHADTAEQPVVNYLLAAESAQQCGDSLKANEYLQCATQLAGADDFPVNITRTRIQLAQNENQAARHSVDQLLAEKPRHPEVLRLAEQAYLRTGAYQVLLDVLPSMYKIRLYSEEKLDNLQQRGYIGVMHDLLNNQGSDGLKTWWKQQGRKTRHNLLLQLEVATLFIESDDHQSAQNVILDGIKKAYDPRLIQLIPRLKLVDPEPLEKVLRQQLRTQGDLPLLNSALGQLLLREGKWQDAKDTLTKAIQQQPNTHDCALLADTLDKLNQPDEATKIRQQGITLRER